MHKTTSSIFINANTQDLFERDWKEERGSKEERSGEERMEGGGRGRVVAVFIDNKWWDALVSVRPTEPDDRRAAKRSCDRITHSGTLWEGPLSNRERKGSKRGREGEKKRELEDQGMEGEKNYPWTLQCLLPYFNSLVYKQTFFTLHFVDMPASHFLGTDLNYPMRSQLCFITRQNKNVPWERMGTKDDRQPGVRSIHFSGFFSCVVFKCNNKKSLELSYCCWDKTFC